LLAIASVQAINSSAERPDREQAYSYGIMETNVCRSECIREAVLADTQDHRFANKLAPTGRRICWSCVRRSNPRPVSLILAPTKNAIQR
jgi:hypothetical protein